jgi:hypothetical protein
MGTDKALQAIRNYSSSSLQNHDWMLGSTTFYLAPLDGILKSTIGRGTSQGTPIPNFGLPWWNSDSNGYNCRTSPSNSTLRPLCQELYNKVIGMMTWEAFLCTKHLAKTNVVPISNLVGDKVREVPPTVSNIPPKTHPVGPSSFLGTSSPSLDPILFNDHQSPYRIILLCQSPEPFT